MSDLSSPDTLLLQVHDVLEAVAVPAALHCGGELIGANDAMCRLAGRRLELLQALRHTELVQEADRDALALASAQCLETGAAPPALLTRLLTPDGGQRSVELHTRAIEIGGRRALVLTCVDQSDFEHVQSSLIGLTEMLRQVVDGAPIASFVIDREHRVTHWNSACERLTGVPRQRMVGSREAWRAFYPNQRPLLLDLLVDGADAEALAAVYGDQASASLITPGGFEAEAFFPQFGASGAWLYFTAAPLCDAQGQIVGAIETLQDVTQRRRTEDELVRHRNELEQLVDQRTAELAASARELEVFITNAPIGVAYTAQGQVLRANRTMAEMFGYEQGQMRGLPGSTFYRGADDYAEFGKSASAALSRGEPLHDERWMRHVSGRSIWVQIDAHVANAGNTAVGTWWMMQDRTEIRAAQEQLQARLAELSATNGKLEEAQNQLLQQDKMASIGQLAAGVAHEINNPVGFVGSNLNSLRQYVDGLLALVTAYEQAFANPGDAAAAAEVARRRDEVEIDYVREDLPQLLDECTEGLGRVKKIVQDLKDFSRLDQSDWQEADLNAGLESTLNVVRHEVKYKVDVQRQLQPLPPVTCLAAQLNQVFLNLIVNAVHAIGEHGTLTLSSGLQEGWAWVQVDDTGCGMSEDVRRRVFEPFYTTKEVGKGTGLGLSLSFSIVQKHGGAIEVRSTPKVGSSFRIWVPVSGPQSLPAGAVPPAWT